MPRPLAELLSEPALLDLLKALRQAASARQPERELTRLISELTGGAAELRASWGDVVARAGERELQWPVQEHKLSHGGRHVGRLLLWLPAPWEALGSVVAEYALLARLQTAAAGAARRRVGERTLDALLSGRSRADALGGEPFAVAIARPSVPLGSGASAKAAQAHALDVLAGVGEGYFAERQLRGLCTVWEDQAVWLWPVRQVNQEAGELYAALTASIAQEVRLGVSARHTDLNVPAAFAEARQALSATREASGYTIFQDMDALFALLSSGALSTLSQQVLAQLAALGDGGKVEVTLRAYLAHQGPLSELAQRLNVHMNTLRYRLRRAEDALGGSLSDPALLARLYLAFGG